MLYLLKDYHHLDRTKSRVNFNSLQHRKHNTCNSLFIVFSPFFLLEDFKDIFPYFSLSMIHECCADICYVMLGTSACSRNGLDAHAAGAEFAQKRKKHQKIFIVRAKMRPLKLWILLLILISKFFFPAVILNIISLLSLNIISDFFFILLFPALYLLVKTICVHTLAYLKDTLPLYLYLTHITLV